MTGDVADAPPRRWRWETITGGGAVLQRDGYRRFWLARLCANTALNAVLFTLLVLAVGEGAGSSIKSALFVTAYLLPTATLGTISGVIVDRLPKNLLLGAVSAGRVGLMVILATSSSDIWTIYGVALFIATSSQFAAPAEAAALPQLVRQDQITTANSANNFGGLISQVIGFALIPPLLLNTVGERPVFLVAAVLFGIAGFFFLTIKQFGSREIDIDHAVDAVKDVRRQFAEAWEQLKQDFSSYMSIMIFVLASTASLVAVTLMPSFTQNILDVPVRHAIFIFMPAAAGILAGLRLVQVLERRTRLGWLVGAGFILLIVAFVCMSLTVPFAEALESLNPAGIFSPGPFGDTSARIIIAMIFSTAAAFAFAVVGVASRSVVNERVPNEIQGRIFAAQAVLTNLASIPPILLAGLLSELVGVAPVMILTVVILAGAAGWSLANAYARQESASDAAVA